MAASDQLVMRGQLAHNTLADRHLVIANNVHQARSQFREHIRYIRVNGKNYDCANLRPIDLEDSVAVRRPGDQRHIAAHYTRANGTKCRTTTPAPRVYY